MVVNFGLHYRWKEREVFRNELIPVFQLMANVSLNRPDAIFIWRECTAQHHVSEQPRLYFFCVGKCLQ